MSFELNLLLFNLFLPLLLTLVLLLGVNSLCGSRQRAKIVIAAILFLVSLVIAIGVSNSGKNFFEFSSEDPWRRLPWLLVMVATLELLGCGLVSLLSVRRDESHSQRTDLCDGAAIWLLRSSALLVLGWWLIPKGQAWIDTAVMQPLWMLVFALGAVWCWWCVSAIRRFSAKDDERIDARSGKGTAWRLWILIGPLLVMVALAGQSFASLAESLLTLSAIGLGVVLASWNSRNPLVTVWSEGVLSVGLASGTMMAMVYSSSSVPTWSYLVVLAVPLVVTTLDALWKRLRLKMVYRMLLAAVTTALILVVVLAQVLANQPAETW